jgi:hypothetical protein
MKVSELKKALENVNPDLEVCYGEGESVEIIIDDLEGAIYLLENIPIWPDCQFNQIHPEFIEFGEPDEDEDEDEE